MNLNPYGAFEGAAEGAAAGALFGGVGAIVGGGLGLLSGLFSPSAEDEMTDRYNSLISTYERLRAKKRQESIKLISGLKGGARSGAAQRAEAGGRRTNAEAFILPAEQKATEIGVNAYNTADQGYDELEARAAETYAGRPIQPSYLDYFGAGASVVGQYGLAQNYLANMGKFPGATDSADKPKIATESPNYNSYMMNGVNRFRKTFLNPSSIYGSGE